MPQKREGSQRKKLASSSLLSYLKGKRAKIISKKILYTPILKMKREIAAMNRLIEKTMQV
jgi:hypothetical protein